MLSAIVFSSDKYIRLRYTYTVANISKLVVVHGFIARKRFQKLLLAAEQQAKMITDFLKLISPPTQGLFDKQKQMTIEDEKRPKGEQQIDIF